jgi:protein-S-isoprenylcysteine O-methyltransferase Ste14
MLTPRQVAPGVRFATERASMFATLSSVRLQKLAFVAREVLERNAPIALRLSGLHLKAEQPARGLGSLGVLALGLLWVCDPGLSSGGSALACFLAAATLRFGFLFASFVPRGIAARLTARLGVERGHAVYSMALDLLLFLQRASFIALVFATARESSGPFGAALQVLGFLLVPVGVGATIWAARIVGLDAWYYRDLFTGSRNVSLESDGPYALLPNPMYALGPLAGYGLALLALSPVALFVAGLNQALLFVFNELVEQPRLRRANGIFVETQRRYELARSLLGFDPRQELAQRVHLDPASQPASLDAGRLAICSASDLIAPQS